MQKKILFIRFSSIGDIVLTTPVVRCAKQQLDAEVHYLTKEAYAPVLHGNPNIDRIIAIREDVHEVRAQLRAEQYDWVADMHHNLRSLRVKKALRRPGAAFPKLNVEKWLMTTFKINRLPQVHIVDRYFRTVEALGVKNDGRGLDVFVDERQHVDVHEISGGKLRSGGFVAMAVGAGLATKNMVDDQWLTAIKNSQMPVALLGGPDDASRGAWLAERSDQCINLAGQLSLQQSASVIAQAAVLLTPDTGLMHIAAALRTPVVSVWGNTIPEFGMAPYYPEGMERMYTKHEVKGLPCRPCSKIGYAQCPKGHFRCIRDIDLEAVAERIRRVPFNHP